MYLDSHFSIFILIQAEVFFIGRYVRPYILKTIVFVAVIFEFS